ncbi:hypothetical protein HYT26_02220 [Candidatus Pacearchaeota archaeon]|nr:hypothetical protein [Candidatus Pacearchaeota archaeon]
MEFKECLTKESGHDEKEAYGFLVEVLNRCQHRISGIKDIVIKEMYTDENMLILVRDYSLSIRNAFDTARLMNEKAYSKETETYAKEREEDLKDISFRVSKKINEMLDKRKRETRSMPDSA